MKRRISTVFTFLSRGIFVVSNYVIHIILGRFFTPSQYGIWGIIFNVLNICRNVLNNGLPQAIAKYLSEGKYKAHTVVKKMVILQIVLSLVIFISFYTGADAISHILKDISYKPYFRIASLIVPVMAIYSLFLGTLNGLRKHEKYAYGVTIYSVCRVLLILTFVFIGYKVKGALVAYLISTFIALLYVAFESRKEIVIETRQEAGKALENFDSMPYNRIIKFAGPISLFSILLNILMTLDIFFVKRVLISNQLLGYYNASATLSKFPYFLFTSFSITLLPELTKRINQEGVARAQEYLSGVLEIFLVMLIPALAIISGSAYHIIDLIYSTEYIQAAESFRILIFSYGIYTISYLLATALFSYNEVKKPLYTVLLLIPLNCVLYIYFIKQYNLIGAAYVSLAISIAMLFILFVFTNKYFTRILSGKKVFIMLLISLVTFLASYYIQFMGVMLILECGILYILSVLILLMSFRINFYTFTGIFHRKVRNKSDE